MPIPRLHSGSNPKLASAGLSVQAALSLYLTAPRRFGAANFGFQIPDFGTGPHPASTVPDSGGHILRTHIDRESAITKNCALRYTTRLRASRFALKVVVP